MIGSGDIFMSDDETIDKLRKKFPGLCAVDMEATAIAHTCSLFGTSYLVIRAVSDIAGAESPMKFDEFVHIAAKNSAQIVRRIVKNSPRLL
jgi:adenosylhomocysteine nucleosidase